MIRIVAAAALAAFLIYDATTAPGFTGGLEAREQPTRELKGDRLPPRPLESLCSETASPYDRSSCLADHVQPDGPALAVRPVRVVTTDRLPDGSFRQWLTN